MRLEKLFAAQPVQVVPHKLRALCISWMLGTQPMGFGQGLGSGHIPQSANNPLSQLKQNEDL